MKIIDKTAANFHSFGEIIIFARILLLATILPVPVGLLTLPQLLKTLTPRRQNCNDRATQDRIIKYTNYILNLDFLMFRNTCLKRSLLLYHFLRESGVDVGICFGVRYKKDVDGKRLEKLEGHAWLSLGGEIFLEKDPEETKTFATTYFFPDTSWVMA